MRRPSLIATLGFVVLANVVAGGWWLADRGSSADDADGIITASGRIENQSVRVSAAVGGRIELLLVRAGESVDAGQVLAQLDRRSLDAARRSADAAVAAAEATVEMAGRQAAAIESQLDLARTEAARYRRLYERDAAPRQAAERAEAALSQLENERRAADAAADQARRQVEAARAQLAAVSVQLDETTIIAPISGVVEEAYLRAGEMVWPAVPILAIRPAGEATLVVYLPLSEATHVRVGDEARIRVEGIAERHFGGTVSHIAAEAEFTPRDIHMPDERATLVFRVEIRVPDPDRLMKDGFPADAWLRPDPAAAWPAGDPW